MNHSAKNSKLPQTDRKATWDKRLQLLYRSRPKLAKALVYTAVSMILIIINFYPRQYITSQEYQAGEIANKTIRVLRDLEVQDLVTIKQSQKTAAEQTQEVYDLAPELPGTINQELADFFAEMRELYQPAPKKGEEPIAIPPSFKKEREEEIVSELGVELTETEIGQLVQFRFAQEILSKAQTIVSELYAQPLVIDREQIQKAAGKGITVLNLKTQERTSLFEFTAVRDLNEVRKELNKKIQLQFSGYPFALRKLMDKIISELLQPNLTFDKSGTEREVAQAVASVKPVYFKLKRGEVIVRKGDRISEEQWKKIEAIQNIRTPFESWLMFFGIFILLWLSQYFVYHFADRNIKKFKINSRDLIFLSLMLVVSLLGLKLAEYLGSNLKENFSLPDGINFYYLAGIAGSAMLVRMVLNSETAVVYTLLLSGFAGLVAGFDFYAVLYCLTGGVVAAGEVGTCEQRGKIFRAGIYLGLVSMIVAIAFSLVQNTARDQELLIYNGLFAFLGGLVAAVVVTGITPVVESVFGYATNIKMLELLNQEHPLLKELSVKASGTHQHSLLTANLAEAAAEAIGANPILSRVMAMYHDIGKMEMPQYFAENQWDEKNPHSKIKPTMSALILIKHVKEGMELADKYKLPREVVEAIQQHHGTNLIKFFYEKAKEMEDPELDTIDEQDFRYPGPRPQTREAGILLLADIVESAARSIREPNPDKIKGMVQNLINRVFVDGQLEECELTLKNLHEIAKAFSKILGAMYHARPEYPQPVEKGAPVGKKRDSNPDFGHELAEARELREADPDKSKEVIKRLGD